MIYLLDPERESGPAADTGTASHHGIATYHKGAKADAAIAEMRASVAAFPLADIPKAEEYVRAYTSDPRNAEGTVIEGGSERLVQFTLDPHPLDETQSLIYFEGTLDQLRRVPRGLEVWDYKTGVAEGWLMLHEFAPQLAAYAVGAAKMLGEPVYVGGVIRGRGYFDGRSKKAKPSLSPDGVFFESPLSSEGVDALLLHIRLKVAMIRRGIAMFGPGEHCGHCPVGGFGPCISEGKRLGLTVV